MKKILVLNILIFSSLVLLAQQTGTPNQIRVLTDANNSLILASAAQSGTVSQPTLFSNTRLRTDSNGSLLVTPFLTGGSGTNSYKASGMLTTPVSTQVPSTADTNFVCVSLGSISANTISKAGDTVEIISDWERSAAAATITLTINLGGTCVADGTGFTGGTNIVSSTALSSASNGYDAHVYVVRGASATLSRIRAWFVKVGTGTITGDAASQAGNPATLIFSNTQTVGIGFKTSASGATDVMLNTARVMFYPAP